MALINVRASETGLPAFCAITALQPSAAPEVKTIRLASQPRIAPEAARASAMQHLTHPAPGRRAMAGERL